MIDWQTELRWAGIYVPAYTLIIPVLLFAGRLVRSSEVLRKIGHVLLVLGALPTIVLFHSPIVVGGLAVILEASLFLLRRLNVLPEVFRPTRRSCGDLLIAPVLFSLWLLGQRETLLFVGPALILALADPAATAVGNKFGRTRYSVAGTRRSFEGSLAFYIVSLIILIVIGYPRFGAGGPLLVRSGVVALAAAIVEGVSPFGLDNFTAPMVAALMMSLVGLGT